MQQCGDRIFILQAQLLKTKSSNHAYFGKSLRFKENLYQCYINHYMKINNEHSTKRK